MGVTSKVNAFAIDTANDVLYVGGGFTQAGGISSVGIAAWDGTSWSEVGGGVNCDVYPNALAIYHQKLYVGGCMTMAGGTLPVSYIACWDGVQWSDVGGGTQNVVSSLYTYNDSLWVGGFFDTVAGGAMPAPYLAKWYDPTFGTVGINELNAQILELKVWPNPTGGVITIELPALRQDQGDNVGQAQGDGNMVLRIFNVAGELLEQHNLSLLTRNFELNTTSWGKGSYLIELTSDGSKATATVVVE